MVTAKVYSLSLPLHLPPPRHLSFCVCAFWNVFFGWLYSMRNVCSFLFEHSRPTMGHVSVRVCGGMGHICTSNVYTFGVWERLFDRIEIEGQWARKSKIELNRLDEGKHHQSTRIAFACELSCVCLLSSCTVYTETHITQLTCSSGWFASCILYASYGLFNVN